MAKTTVAKAVPLATPTKKAALKTAVAAVANAKVSIDSTEQLRTQQPKSSQ